MAGFRPCLLGTKTRSSPRAGTGRGEDADFTPVRSSEILHLPEGSLRDWSNSDDLSGSLQAAREYSLMRPWSRCLHAIGPPSGTG